MQNFPDTYEICKRSFISLFSICMTVPLIYLLLNNVLFVLEDAIPYNAILYQSFPHLEVKISIVRKRFTMTFSGFD